MTGTASFSHCGRYRFRLTREWNKDKPAAVVIGANPSTATAEVDDATIRLETGILTRWGYGFYIKLNAYAFRATLPKDMWAAAKSGLSIIGIGNNEAICEALDLVSPLRGIVIAAWGGIDALVRQEVQRQARILSVLFSPDGTLVTQQMLPATIHSITITGTVSV